MFRPFRLAIIAVCLACALPSWAEAPSDALNRAREELGRAGLDEAGQREAEAALDAAAEHESRAVAALAATTQLRELAATAEREQRALQTRLTDDPLRRFREWRQRLPQAADLEQLETLLATERAEVNRLRGEVEQVLAGLKALAEATAPAAIEQEAELRLAADELQRRLEALSAAPQAAPSALLQARMLRLKAELRAAQAELERRATERSTAAARQQLLELRQRVAQRELGDREQRVEVLQSLIAQRGGDQRAALLAALQAEQAEFASADPALQVVANENLAMGTELERVSTALATLRTQTRELDAARADLADALRNTRARLAIDSDSEALGLILLGERRRLPSTEALQRRLAQLRRELGAAKLQQIAVAEQRERLRDLPEAVSLAVGAADGDEEESALLREGLYRLLGSRAELLPRLDSALQRYIAALEQAEQVVQAQSRDAAELRELLDRRLYWTPSHARVDLDWLRRQPAGWHDLLKPSRWPVSFKLLLQQLAQAPLLPLLCTIVASVLLVYRRRVPEKLLEYAPPRRVHGDRYRLSLKALGVTVAAALPGALLVFALADALLGAGEGGRFSHSLGRALLSVAGTLLLLDFLRWLVVERGLAHLHFRWTRARREALARALPWLRLVLLPSQFLGVLAFVRGQDLAIDTAGRLVMLLSSLFAAWWLWRLLAPGGLWTPRGGTAEPNRLRQMMRIALPALLVGMAGMLAQGYVFSSSVLMVSLWWSMWTIVAVALVHGMLARWFLLGERRLALKRLEEKRAAEREAGAEENPEALPEVEVEQLALETVNAQTGRLLRALTLSLWVFTLLWIWAEALPALGRLEEIRLWTFSTVGADGAATQGVVTLKAALFGVVVLALTFVAVRNVPGLLELSLLPRIAIDAPTRYAIASISRYLIVITGSIVGLGLLGLRWSQLQWMAAALTVGLGFGLQEIFANFVSGLILLFERPFRVGDLVTIDTYTGTVSRIRTRATTLVDADHKDIVVPNRFFITNRFVNWTLSNNRTRVVIKVGAAYGSDVSKVHALLRQAAEEQPKVLRDPAPSTWLVAFGPNSLDFELRVFVDTLSDRMPVTNALHMHIAELFAEHGIDIAPAQIDVHVKEWPAPPAPVPGSGPDRSG